MQFDQRKDMKHGGITEGRRNGDVVIKRLDTVQLGVRVVCVPLFGTPLPNQAHVVCFNDDINVYSVHRLVCFNSGRPRITEIAGVGNK
jgi:hypothetical protein